MADKILMIAAAGPGIILSAYAKVVEDYPKEKILLFLPAGTNVPPELINHVLFAANSDIAPDDLHGLPISDITILVIGHVGCASYPRFVSAICARNGQAMLFTPACNDLQILDIRDADTDLMPVRGNKIRRNVAKNARKWLFFRAWDKPAQMIARRLQKNGCNVRHVSTVAEFERLAPISDAVFLDWCITNYSALANAITIALKHQLEIEAWLALDLADLAEDDNLSLELESFNKNAFEFLDKAWILKSRYPVFNARYNLPDRFKPHENIENMINQKLWRAERRHPRLQRNDCLRISYHGLCYYWHELVEFMPVYQELLKLHAKTQLFLFGRIHESIEISGQALFPEKEQKVRQGIEQLCRMPGVVWRGFADICQLLETIRQSDFYLGIVAGASVMADSEIRTGVCEAVQMRIPVLHKTTSAIRLAGFRSDVDYIDVDALNSALAAKKIFAAWKKRRGRTA